MSLGPPSGVASGMILLPSIQATTVVSLVSANVNESAAVPPYGPLYVSVIVALLPAEVITSFTWSELGPEGGVLGSNPIILGLLVVHA